MRRMRPPRVLGALLAALLVAGDGTIPGSRASPGGTIVVASDRVRFNPGEISTVPFRASVQPSP